MIFKDILYSLTKAGVKQKELEEEINSLKKRLESSEDPYMLALLANTRNTFNKITLKFKYVDYNTNI